MFGCCNSLFSSCCRCGQRCGNPPPVPIYPPVVPPAPPQLRGMQISLTGSSAGSVAQGGCVPFDTVDSNNTLGVSTTPGSGMITISRAGTYLVNWWIATENAQSAETMTIELSLNGAVVQTSCSDIGGGQVYGTAIVRVSSLPSVLKLTNVSGDAVTLVTADQQAGMTITQFA